MLCRAVHKVEVVRALKGKRAVGGVDMKEAWDPDRQREGGQTDMIGMASGGFTSMPYSGYAH